MSRTMKRFTPIETLTLVDDGLTKEQSIELVKKGYCPFVETCPNNIQREIDLELFLHGKAPEVEEQCKRCVDRYFTFIEQLKKEEIEREKSEKQLEEYVLWRKKVEERQLERQKMQEEAREKMRLLQERIMANENPKPKPKDYSNLRKEDLQKLFVYTLNEIIKKYSN